MWKRIKEVGENVFDAVFGKRPPNKVEMEKIVNNILKSSQLRHHMTKDGEIAYTQYRMGDDVFKFIEFNLNGKLALLGHTISVEVNDTRVFHVNYTLFGSNCTLYLADLAWTDKVETIMRSRYKVLKSQ